MKPFLILVLAAAISLLTGCVTVPPKDYTAFRAHQPKSILVLPPANETVEVLANYSVLTTVTQPLAELGYYVYPVVVVDQFMKANGISVPQEMHAVPLEKLHSTFGADSVLYITVEKYGSKYQVISSNVFVFARAKLVDCRSGTVLWEGSIQHQQAGSAGLIEALVEQVINKLADGAHGAATMASFIMFNAPNQGLLRGARHPEFGKTQ